MKLYTISKKWIVEDRGVNKIFDTSLDAWTYIFIMREIRPKVPHVPDLYPVRSLVPFPNTKGKKVIWK